jgi:aminoglycoside phosphotransferase (APT) family kinase protein
MNPPTTILDSDTLQRILYMHRLGNLQSVHEPAQGYMNWCFILNDAFVLRVDAGRHSAVGRFLSERRAYDLLKYSGIPVPRVIALDRSKSVVPYEYIITTKLPGVPVTQAWPSLNPAQQTQVAQSVGRYLAELHSHSTGHFGDLRTYIEAPYHRWYDFCLEAIEHFLDQARTQASLSPALADASLAYFRAQPALFDTIQHGYLVHSDYHFENILQENGVVTGIIDFEWALSGDPTWDFIVEDKWEAFCAGSREPLMAAYTRVRPLDEAHAARLKFYKLLLAIETLVMQHKDGDLVGKQLTLAHIAAVVG